jgi:Glycosyl transferase family 2
MLPSPSITAIVPATNRPATLGRCVAALDQGLRPPDETVVVTEPRGAGPAAARNEGARRAQGDVLVFVDADVVVHPDALARIEAAFAGDFRLTALFGSYDDSPEAPGVVSGFRNLLHHHVHTSSAGPAATFWAGLGAIRREPFLVAGGFDSERYPRPSIEDIELGARMAKRGERIILDPGVQGTHLKAWTLAEMLRTDFARRGVPWVELLVEEHSFLRPGDRSSTTALNLGWRHRLSAFASVAAAAALLRRRPLTAVAAVAVLVGANRELYALVLRRRGPSGLAAGVALHAVHHLTSAAALIVGLLRFVRGAQKSHQRS